MDIVGYSGRKVLWTLGLFLCGYMVVESQPFHGDVLQGESDSYDGIYWSGDVKGCFVLYQCPLDTEPSRYDLFFLPTPMGHTVL